MNKTQTIDVTGQGQYRRVEVRASSTPPSNASGTPSPTTASRKWWAAGTIEPREGGKYHLGGMDTDDCEGLAPARHYQSLSTTPRPRIHLARRLRAVTGPGADRIGGRHRRANLVDSHQHGARERHPCRVRGLDGDRRKPRQLFEQLKEIKLRGALAPLDFLCELSFFLKKVVEFFSRPV